MPLTNAPSRASRPPAHRPSLSQRLIPISTSRLRRCLATRRSPPRWAASCRSASRLQRWRPCGKCLDGRMIRNGSTTIQSSTWTSSRIRRSTSIPAPPGKDGFDTDQRGMFWNGVMEYLVRLTNEPFVAQARGAGVDVTYDRDAYGIHDWPYYKDALGKSWTKVIGPALGAYVTHFSFGFHVPRACGAVVAPFLN